MQIRVSIKLLYYKLFSFILLTSVLGGSFSTVSAMKTPYYLNAEYSINLLNPGENVETVNPEVQIPNCPDVNGIIRGTARINIADAKSGAGKNTIVEAKITGYVDDNAELTHFDLNGTTSENGVNQVSFSVEESKITATSAGTTQQGRTMVNVSPNLDAQNPERLGQTTGSAVKSIFEQASGKLRAARQQWRSGACVEVKLSAPKTTLSAGEKIVVTAESRHKLEKIAIPAKLLKKEASASATPDEQRGIPQARFTLTAPTQSNQKALLVVESVSKRGIGLGKLEFAENAPIARKPVAKTQVPTKTPPTRKGICNGAWSGKITVEKRLKKESSKPASGRLLREINNKNETINLEYHVLGIQDTSGGFVNGYFADTKMNFTFTEYRENFYAAGKTSCDKKIISTTELRTTEIVETASASERLTIYITSRGEKGIFTLDSPEINANRIVTRKYETACPSYDQVNSGVDKSDGLIGHPKPFLEIEFELDAKSDHQLNGSKTIQNSDGSETIVTWTLTRDCK